MRPAWALTSDHVKRCFLKTSAVLSGCAAALRAMYSWSRVTWDTRMSGSLAFDVGHDGVDGVEVLRDGVVVLHGEAERLLDEHDELEGPHGVDDVGPFEGDVVLERVGGAASQEA